jgi:DNA-binding NarL/FixJ family response regulator
MNKIKIVIVDDHSIVCEGIKAMLSFYNDLDVIGTFNSFSNLKLFLAKQVPDVIILDIEIPEVNGLQIAEILNNDFPKIKKIILSAFINPETISQAIEAGVVSILPKDTNEDELHHAIIKAVQGENYYSSFVSKVILKNYLTKDKVEKRIEICKLNDLSTREIEIIRAFGEGLSYKEIGDNLNISPRTVESHKNRILIKLELHTIIDIVKFGIKSDIIKL